MRILADYRIFQEADGWAFEVLLSDGKPICSSGGYSTRKAASKALTKALDAYVARAAATLNPAKEPNAFLRQVFQVKEG